VIDFGASILYYVTVSLFSFQLELHCCHIVFAHKSDKTKTDRMLIL